MKFKPKVPTSDSVLTKSVTRKGQPEPLYEHHGALPVDTPHGLTPGPGEALVGLRYIERHSCSIRYHTGAIEAGFVETPVVLRVGPGGVVDSEHLRKTMLQIARQVRAVIEAEWPDIERRTREEAFKNG